MKELRLAGRQTVHILCDPPDETLAVTGLRLNLKIRGLRRETKARLILHDPLNRYRTMTAFDFLIAPSTLRAGDGLLRMTFDLQDFMLADGARLRLSLVCRNPIAIRLAGSSIELIENNSEKVQRGYIRNQLRLIQDLFKTPMVSEARAYHNYKKVGLERLTRQYRNYSEFMRLYRDLLRYDPQNKALRSYWIWTHRYDPAPYVNIKLRPSSAPKWAQLQRLCLKRFLEFAHWWVDNRQIPQGHFGGSLGDDTDLVQDWPNLIGICLRGDSTGR